MPRTNSSRKVSPSGKRVTPRTEYRSAGGRFKMFPNRLNAALPWEGKRIAGPGPRLRAGLLRACLKSPDSCTRPDRSPAIIVPPAWTDSATRHGTSPAKAAISSPSLQVPYPERSVIRRPEGAAPVGSLRSYIREVHSCWSHRLKATSDKS